MSHPVPIDFALPWIGNRDLPDRQCPLRSVLPFGLLLTNQPELELYLFVFFVISERAPERADQRPAAKRTLIVTDNEQKSRQTKCERSKKDGSGSGGKRVGSTKKIDWKRSHGGLLGYYPPIV